jgi:hypothetical protein
VYMGDVQHTPTPSPTIETQIDADRMLGDSGTMTKPAGEGHKDTVASLTIANSTEHAEGDSVRWGDPEHSESPLQFRCYPVEDPQEEATKCIAYHHMDKIFSSIDRSVGELWQAQAVPNPTEEVGIAGHLLGASELYSSEEFNASVHQVVEQLSSPGESTRIYNEALVVRFVHLHDLCPIPEEWEPALQQGDRAFFSTYNLEVLIQGSTHRFFQTDKLFKRMSSLNRGKLSREGHRDLFAQKKKSERVCLSDSHHPNVEILGSRIVRDG